MEKRYNRCGGVASVAIHKCCQNSEAFEEICIA